MNILLDIAGNIINFNFFTDGYIGYVSCLAATMLFYSFTLFIRCRLKDRWLMKQSFNTILFGCFIVVLISWKLHFIMTVITTLLLMFNRVKNPDPDFHFGLVGYWPIALLSGFRKK